MLFSDTKTISAYLLMHIIMKISYPLNEDDVNVKKMRWIKFDIGEICDFLSP